METFDKMSDFRRKALSNANTNEFGNGSRTNKNGTNMEKTDSVVNLTKPALYAIYNVDSVTNLNSEDGSNEYLNIANRKYSKDNIEVEDVQAHMKTSSAKKYAELALKLAILTVSAYAYNEMTSHIHSEHLKINEVSYEPLYITNKVLNGFIQRFLIARYLPIPKNDYITSVDKVVSLTLQGCLMGCIHPLMDSIMPPFLSKRLLSSNPTPNKSSGYSNIANDLIRASITFLGISYAIRKIEWNSFLQASIIWSLLNPGLWLLLDGTINGFIFSLLFAFLAFGSIYFQNPEVIHAFISFKQDDAIAICLLVASFFFCGLILFGKLGRFLFRD